jgi:hypothetical protein
VQDRPAANRRLVTRALLVCAATALWLAAATPANAQFAFNTFITQGDATTGWVTDTNTPPGATDQLSLQLFVNSTSSLDFDDAARALFTGVPAELPTEPPSFFFKVSTAGASGGSVRLLIRFNDGGNGELRPLSFQAGQWSFVNGAGPNWDTTGGSCGYQTGQSYSQVLACHTGAQVTSVEILNDSGWLYPGGFAALVDNISYAGVTLSGPAAPVADATVNLTQLSGDVVVRVPQAVGGQAPPIGTASGSVARLSGTTSLPLGSVIDSRDGRVSLFALRRNRRQLGNFSDGRFRVRQSDDGEVLLTLRGNLDCGARSVGAPRAEASATRRRLWGSSRGRFRTRGSYSSGSVRGTKWLTVDRCDGTLTVVREGVVQVHDYGTGARVLVPAGQSYFAQATP